MTYEQFTNETLAGKTIVTAEVSGYSVTLTFSDGTRFIYYASDGGYSSWDVLDVKPGEESK